MQLHNKGRASPWLVLSALCLSAATALAVPWAVAGTRAASVTPAPTRAPQAQEQALVQDARSNSADGYVDPRFPKVDWDYWETVNPSIVAWVTVPGTGIDYAVVQAPASDPAYYLSHDIYGGWSPYGCPYVDAACNGTNGYNTVISGHNMGLDSSMFGDFACYKDKAFADAHADILFQTPDVQVLLAVSAVAIVEGSEQSKRTGFSSQAQLAHWYSGRYAEADVQLADNERAFGLITFVTCSYSYYFDERTLVYAQPKTTERTSP